MNTSPSSVIKRQAGDTNEVPIPQRMLGPGTLRFFDSTDNGKVFPYMNRAHLYDSTGPGFLRPPTDTSKIKLFLDNKWFDAETQLWAWKPENSINGIWPLEEDLAFTNPTLLTAGMGGSAG